MYYIKLTVILLFNSAFMGNLLKNHHNPRRLAYLGMQILERLDSSLTALERIIFLRFLLRYGLAGIPKKNLKTAAEQIDIRLPAFKKAVAVLLEKGGLCDVGNGQIRISTGVLKSGLTATKMQMSRSGVAGSNLKSLLPRVDFLVQLFRLLFQIRISHKQKNANELLKLNYQQWLVLLNMVWRSDYHGVVLEAGTHELVRHTGMSRDALLRAITALFQCGLLRSKLNGTLNSNLLHSMSAIYFLNLSHPIWQDKCRYAEYYIVRFPSDYQSICQQAFNALRSMFEQQNSSAPSDLSNHNIHALVNEPNHQTYHIAPIPLVEDLAVYVQRGKDWDPNFLEHLQLLLSTFKNHHTKLNTVRDNVQRMNFLLHAYLTQKICNFGQMQEFSASVDYQMLSSWFNRYLQKISLSTASQRWIKQQRLDFTEVLRAQEEIRNRALFVITWTILNYELRPVLQPLFDKERGARRWEAMDIAWLGNSQETEYQIYYSLSRCTEQQHDQFYLVEFNETQSSGGGYRIEHHPVDLKPEHQMSYGLLNDQFVGFNLTAS